jgi:hypothetical protein
MSNTDHEQPFAYPIAQTLLLLFGVIGFTAVGVSIWLWASTSPNLVIGEDISAEAILTGVVAIIITVVIIGTAFLTYTLRGVQMGSDGSENRDESNDESEGTSERNQTEVEDSGPDTGDTGRSEERDPNPPEPEQQGSQADSGDFSQAEKETGIVFDDGPAPGADETCDSGSAGSTATSAETHDTSPQENQEPSRESSDNEPEPANTTASSESKSTETGPETDTEDESATRAPGISTDDGGEIQPAERDHVPQWLRDRL